MSLNHILDSPSLQRKLKRAGYENLETLVSANLIEIVKELQLNQKEQKYLFDVVNTELRERKEIKQNEKLYSISTQSKNINALFGYGIPFKKITEICGEAGSGKTQLCMQLALNALLPAEQGGEPGECIYIDTEGSFSFHGRLSHISNIEDMERLHVFHASHYTEVMSFVIQLPNMLEAYPNTKLIIIDSIAYHFRVNILTKNVRDSLLDFIGLSLFRIAKQKNLAIVVSNHVTQEENNSTWIPSLGSSWGNWCNSRLFLYRKRNFRFAYLYKSYDPTGSKPVQFCIKSRGITDPVEDELEESIKDEEIRERLDNDINVTFTQLKKEKDEEEEQDRVDMFWKDAYNNPNYINKFNADAYNYSPGSSQQTEQCTQNKEPINEDDDLPTYTQTEFKYKIDEEMPVQNIDTIQEEEESELFSPTICKQEEKEYMYEEDDFASQLPIDEDDDASFLSLPHTNNDSVPYFKNESMPSSQINNQVVYEEEDFIPATQVAEIHNIIRDSDLSNSVVCYQSQENERLEFFEEQDEAANSKTYETLRSSQDTNPTTLLRASLGIELSSTTADDLPFSIGLSSAIASQEKSSESLLNDGEINKDSSFLKEYESLKREVMPEEDISNQNNLSSCKEKDDNLSNSQLSQPKEFDLCPETNTIPKKEENEETTLNPSQVDNVERHYLIKNELINEDEEMEHNSQRSITVSSLSTEEKIPDEEISPQQTTTKKRDHDSFDINENSDCSTKRSKMNLSPENHSGLNNRDLNDNTNEEIRITDQTQNDNTNQTIRDTAVVTASNTKHKEIIADWDSDVEEELDYQYINEINEFI